MESATENMASSEWSKSEFLSPFGCPSLSGIVISTEPRPSRLRHLCWPSGLAWHSLTMRGTWVFLKIGIPKKVDGLFIIFPYLPIETARTAMFPRLPRHRHQSFPGRGKSLRSQPGPAQRRHCRLRWPATDQTGPAEGWKVDSCWIMLNDVESYISFPIPFLTSFWETKLT